MQLPLDIMIFLARHMILGFFVFLAIWWLGPGRRRDWASSPTLSWVRVAPALIGGLVLVTFVVIAAWYVTLDGFAGEVEPVVSSLSWQVQSGQTLYTSFDQAERYSVLYGPSVFLTNGLFLKILGPSLVSVKMASALASVGSLLFLYGALARKRRDNVAFAVTAGAALFYWAQGFSIYLVRPDALLVFALGMGLYVATKSSRWLAIIAVAALAGFTINLKIHSLLYFLPVFVVMGQRLGWKPAGWAFAGSLLVAVGPFAFYPQISAVNYLKWLANETEHGFRAYLLIQPVGYAAFLALPLGVAMWLRGSRHGYLGEQRLVALSILPAAVCALVLSAKPGSGIIHLLPLVPTMMFLVGRLVRPLVAGGLDTWEPRLARSMAAAVILTVLFAGSVAEYRAVRLIDWQVDQFPGIVNDVEEIMERYDGLPMAMALGGEERWYRCTWYQPLLTFHGNPVLLDPISVMDTVKSGKKLAQATYDALSEGRVSLWLVPRSQAPFQKMSWYDATVPIFPQDFVKHFHNNYTLRGQSRYFDLWFWNGLEQVPGSSFAAKN